MTRTVRLRTLGAVALGALLVVGGVAAGLGPALASGGQEAQPAQNAQLQSDGADVRTITVSASGQTAAQPDRALVRVAVESRADDVSVARERVAENVSSMRAALTQLGLDDDQIRTMDYDIRQDRERGPEGRPTDESVYVARHVLVVELENVDRVGTVIDTATESGATNVYGIDFTLSQETREELRTRALERAMDGARDEATVLAEQADVRITDVHSVSTGGRVHVARSFETAAGGDGGGGTSIESGPVTVRATVTVSYEITD